jgi:hypothetical protein
MVLATQPLRRCLVLARGGVTFSVFSSCAIDSSDRPDTYSSKMRRTAFAPSSSTAMRCPITRL